MFLGVVWDSPTMQAHLLPAGVILTLNTVKDIKLGQDMRPFQRCGLRAQQLWKKHWFLNRGLALGMCCHRKSLMMDASLMGWGAIPPGPPPSSGSVNVSPNWSDRLSLMQGIWKLWVWPLMVTSSKILIFLLKSLRQSSVLDLLLLGSCMP